MYVHIEVERISGDGLARELWEYHAPHKPNELHLCTYVKSHRPSRRHNWLTDARWSFLDGRKNTTAKPVAPNDVKAEAIEKYRAQITVKE